MRMVKSMFNMDTLYTQLSTAEYSADDLRCRMGYADKSMINIAMGKDTYRYLISRSGFDSVTDNFGFWMGYKICIINEDQYSDHIFPIIANSHAVVIGNCKAHDRLATSVDTDDPEKGVAVYELKNEYGNRFFAQTDMTVSFHPSSCFGVKMFCPTESEVDAFLSEYIQ